MRSSLKEAVKTQLKIREATANASRIMKARELATQGINAGKELENNNILTKLKLSPDGKTITLPAGAFYTNTVQKQCIVRLYSGVDVKPGTFMQYLSEPTGVEMAQQFFLEGGVKDLYNSTRYTGGTKFGQNDHAYGAKKFRADPHRGYGIVPMPGITDVDIRTVSDFGSLRVAKINFDVHSLNQLEVMEMLYMRPGYPLLLEWGWTPFVNNEGKIINTLPYYQDFWKKTSSMWTMQKELMIQKYQLSGNYDALLGFVKNFDWKSRDDGGFQCTTELMGYGEIMEGIKGRNDLTPGESIQIDNNAETIETYPLYGFDSVIPEWIFSANANEATISSMDNFIWVLSSIMYYKDLDGFQTIETHINEITEYVTGGDKWGSFHLVSDQNQQAFKDPNTFNKTNNIFQKGVFRVIKMLQKLSNGGSGYERSYVDCLRLIDDYLCKMGDHYNLNNVKSVKVRKKNQNGEFIKDENNDYIYEYGPDSKQARAKMTKTDSMLFFRWDFICELLNHFAIDQVKGASTNAEPLSRWDYMNRDGRGMITMARSPRIANHHSGSIKHGDLLGIDVPLGGVYVKNKSTLDIHKSFDPEICLMPGQFFLEGKYSDFTDDGGFVYAGDRHFHSDLSDKDGSSWYKDDDGNIYTPTMGVHYLKPMKEYGTSKSNTTVREGSNGLQGYFYNPEMKDDDAIGLTYINAKYMLEIYKQLKYESDEPFSINKFVTQIWKDVSSKACNDYHNFIVHTEDDAATLRIVDLTVDPSLGPPDDIYRFKVQSDKSIIRDFKVSSKIPDSISAIIASTAQSPNTFDAASTTLSAFSANIESRFTGYNEDDDYSRAQSFDNLMKRFHRLQYDVYSYMDIINTFSNRTNIHDHNVESGWYYANGKYKSQSKTAAKELLSIMHQLNALSARILDPVDVAKDDTYRLVVPDYLDTWEHTDNTEVVPIEIDLQLDGISGVRIGDIIKIDGLSQGPRLPKGYNREDIMFVVFGIKDKITKSQDWIQTLTCKMTIMGGRKDNTPFISYTKDNTGQNEKKKVQLDKVETKKYPCDRYWRSMNGYPFSGFPSAASWVLNPIDNYDDNMVEGLGNYKQYDPMGDCACKDPANRKGCRKHNGIDIDTQPFTAVLCIKPGTKLGKVTMEDFSNNNYPFVLPLIDNDGNISNTCPSGYNKKEFPRATYIRAGVDGKVNYLTGIKGYGGFLTLEGALSPKGAGPYNAGYYESSDNFEGIYKSFYPKDQYGQHISWGKEISTDISELEEKITQQFGHVQQDIWKNGTKVSKGMVIGITGGDPNQPHRGNSSGAHLHYEVKLSGLGGGGFVNPYLFLNSTQYGSDSPSEIELYDLVSGRKWDSIVDNIDD